MKSSTVALRKENDMIDSYEMYKFKYFLDGIYYMIKIKC